MPLAMVALAHFCCGGISFQQPYTLLLRNMSFRMRDALATRPADRILSMPLPSIEQAFSTISSGLAGGLLVTGHGSHPHGLLYPLHAVDAVKSFRVLILRLEVN